MIPHRFPYHCVVVVVVVTIVDVFVPGGFSARDYGIAVVRSLSVVCLLFVVATMKYLLKFHSDCFETLSADFLWPS